jgi:hypothetical protein
VPPPESDASDRIQYVGPDTYILLDKQSRPQPMPGMTFEDFMAAWKQLQQVDKPERSPSFVLESVEIAGQVKEQHARLHVDATVRLLTDEPVTVPLGLVEAILDGEPEFHAADASAAANPAANGSRSESSTTARGEYLDYDPQRGGFIARLIGRRNERRKLSLNVIAPLLRDGTGTTLSLAYPRTTSSKLSLDVQGPVAEATVTSGALVSQEPIGDATRLVVAGAMGPFRLAWQSPERGTAEFTSVLNAEGAIHVAIDGRSVRTEARMTVRSHGGSFDRFRVRLPVGARLIQEQAAGENAPSPPYRLLIDQSPPGASQPAGGEQQSEQQVVLVELREKQRGPVTVNLVTEQPIGLADAASTVQLSGFEVLDAVRQFGDIALEVAPDWQARWNLGPFVRQVEPDELDTGLRPVNLTAAFQYDRQPWSVAVRTVARKLRVVVAPTYELECSTDEARLAVRLTYQVLGARAFEFGVQLNGWELATDPIESGGLVDVDRVQITDDGILTLPLGQASARRVDIEFHLKRSLMGSASLVRLPLPAPIADSIAPAELMVRAGAGQELVPDIEASSGIAAQPLTDSNSTDAVTDTAEYHFRAAMPDAVFAAKIAVRPREISHTNETSVVMDSGSARVEQRIEYEVRHQPIRELALELPAQIDPEAGGFTIYMMLGMEEGGGSLRPAMPVELITDAQMTSTGDLRRASQRRVMLPQPRLGTFSLRINFQVPIEHATNQDRWQLPLIRAVDGKQTSHRVTVRTEEAVDVALDAEAENSESWRPAVATEAANSTSREASKVYTANSAEMTLPLVFRAVHGDMPATTIVDRIWLQSWMSTDARQDRAAFQFRTAGWRVAVELAPQTPDEIEVLLDGSPARVLSRSAGRLLVEVPQATPRDVATVSEPASHTLELRYRTPIQFALVTRHAITPPQLIGRTALSEACWHVVLPSDKHVIRSPDQMTAASQWQWLGGFWGRGPTRSQSDLEKWVGATSQLEPSTAQNQYLYTGLSPVATIALVTTPRWLIVLAASAAVLSLALAGLYLPVLNWRWLLGAGVCVIAVLTMLFPVPALLVAQAALLGVALAVAAAASRRLLAQPTPWRVNLPASTSPRHAASRSDSAVLTPVVAAGSTAPTISLRAPGSD